MYLLAELRLHCCVWAYSNCNELGLLWLCHMALVALRHVGSFQARDQTGVPCIARQILNHWTTREAPRCSVKQDS